MDQEDSADREKDPSGMFEFPAAGRSLPATDWGHRVVRQPHVVLLGAGASRACCPEGDRHGHRLPLMNDLVAVTDLGEVLRRHGCDQSASNFEDLYDGLVDSHPVSTLLQEVESKIRGYFEGLELPHEATVYDRLLLSLRDKDVIATFNWDPLLAQVYKRNRGVARLPRVLFLHGCVAIGECSQCREYGYIEVPCRRCGRRFSPTRLLYPVRRKGYANDPFIRSQWEALRLALYEAYFVTIYGYSAPKSDAEALSLLKGPWSNSATHELAEIEIINTAPREEVESSWKDFFVGSHYGVTSSLDRSYQTYYTRRSCEALFGATMMLDPWHANPMPATRSLAELHAWVRPLINEEQRVARGEGVLTSDGSGTG